MRACEVEEFELAWPRARVPRYISASDARPGPCRGPHFRTAAVNHSLRRPYRAVGLLVEGASGTATTGFLVHPQAILTAAHCLTRNSSGFYFGLQYNRAEGGLWTRLRGALLLRGWQERRDPRCDLALAWLESPYDGEQPLTLTRALAGESALILGYAFGAPHLWRSKSLAVDWHPRSESQAATNLSEGSSGGPWLVKRGRDYAAAGMTTRGGPGFLLSPAWNKGPHLLLEAFRQVQT